MTDPLAVERAVGSQDAVLCALGSSTPLKHDAALVAGIGNLVGAMERLHVRRLVYLSFLGVHHGRRQLSRLGKYVVAPLLMRKVAADHEHKEAIIQRSTLDWVIVRPPRLTNGRRGHLGHLVVPRVSRADLAEFMLRQLNGDTYVRRTPAVMYCPRNLLRLALLWVGRLAVGQLPWQTRCDLASSCNHGPRPGPS